MALVDIANNALGLYGGAADTGGGDGYISASEIADDTTSTAKRINDEYANARTETITRFAQMECPFRETSKFAGLGDDLRDSDVSITDIEVDSGTFKITVTTSKDHNLTTGDTRFMSDIRGDLATDAADVESLNGKTVTVTVTDTDEFTIDTLVGTIAWDYTENSGMISKAPETGAYRYAFALPSDYFCMVRQTDEVLSGRYGTRKKYQYDVLPDRLGTGRILVTNHLTNRQVDSAYIEYCVDLTTFSLFSPALLTCITRLLGIKLCTNIGGRDLETRAVLVAEYEAVVIPQAQAFNQSQFNNSAKVVTDYSGGRSSGGVVPGVGRDLGTYQKADGTRGKIF